MFENFDGRMDDGCRSHWYIRESNLQYFRPSLKLPSVFKSFNLCIFEWPLKTYFTVVVWFFTFQSIFFSHIGAGLTGLN